MVGSITEIRWHGRGGQGAKTVSQLMALALKDTGFYVQAFPEYGPERSGAPMQAYTRSSKKPIRLHCAVTKPDAVAVLDDSLIGKIDVLRGVDSDGLILINTNNNNVSLDKPKDFHGRFFSIDAERLSRESGIKYANVVVAGALAAILGMPSMERLKGAAKEIFEKKLKKAVVDNNLRAIEMGYSNFEKIEV
ncbi:MAG TPA: 2-oxoacid:acceptor oxidoreductase family protein [Balneolaceae bacterium]|nr:2-oxoacid:acceptor oxidoreductase family protein [Balneolaceae bacterium]